MACMEHHCQKCNWYKMDNNQYSYCPNCGSSHVLSYSDEQYYESDCGDDYESDAC